MSNDEDNLDNVDDDDDEEEMELDDTARRFSAICDDILAGTSPLTPKDVMEAIMMPVMIPVEAPALDASPFAQFVHEYCDQEKGIRAAAISWEVVLATLEDRLKRKQADRS